MNRTEKTFLWLAGALAFLCLALLFLLTVAAPAYLSREATKERIRNEFSRAVGGDLDYDRLGISLFPRPGLAVYGASVTIPEMGEGTVESLQVHPWILPLFRGNVRIRKVRVEGFSLEFDPAVLGASLGEVFESDPSRSLEEKAASMFEVLAAKVPGLEVEMEDGEIDILDQEQSALRVRDLEATLVLPPQGPSIRASCKSDLWQELSVEARLDGKELKGGGRIELARFRPHLLADRLLGDTGIGCSESLLYLRVDFETEGLRSFTGEVKTSIPQMTLLRKGEAATLEVEALGFSFAIDKDKTELTLDQLSMDHPRFSMSGRFFMDRSAPHYRLDLEARDMDVEAVREVALCLGGEVRLVRDIFDYVRGGEIPVITFRSLADALDQLGRDEAFRIEGRLREGRIHIRGPGLDPEEVQGDVIISKGILQGRNLEARLGSSTAKDGELRVGLKGKDAPFHLEILVDADLAEVRPILLRVVKAGTFVRELLLVENLEGRGVGTLILGDRLQAVRARVEISDCSLSGEYARIPHTFRIHGGEVFYEKDGIAGRNMSGTLGASAFSGLTWRVLLGGAPRLEIESGRLQLLMDEIFPWLVSYETIRKDLGLFRDVEGRMNITGIQLSGPVLRPAEWAFEAEGTTEDLTLDMPRLCPKPVPIASGRLKATPEELSFREVEARVLDAPLTAKGVLYGYLTGLAAAEVDFRGTVGLQSSQWVSGIIHLPPSLALRTPFQVSNAKLVWNRMGDTTFSGDFQLPKGAKASVNHTRGPRTFRLERLSIQDKESRATFAVTRTADVLGFKFTGNLEHTTLDRIFFGNPAPDLDVKGDFLLNVRRDKPVFSRAQGHLEAKGFSVPYSWMSMFEVEGLSMSASQRGIAVESACLRLADSYISMEGGLVFAPEGIQLDMDLASEAIGWDRIASVIDRARAEEPGEEAPPGPKFGGTVRCRAESFTYGPFTWRPLHGSVTFTPDDLRVAVTEADVCGISTLGALNMEGEELSLDFKVIAQDADLEPALPCLSDTERRVSGRFDLRGDIEGTAREDSLIRALEGEMEFSSRDGNILEDPVLTKVFSLLNVTEILRGKMPDLRSDELPYDSLHIKADLRDGALHLSEAVLSGPTVGIAGDGAVHLIDKEVDLKLVVAPLRTVDFIVEKTPVVSNIMGGKLITVPVRISGNWRDPRVTMLSATAVGSRLLGIMKNTLMLPMDLVEPVLPKKEEGEDSP